LTSPATWEESTEASNLEIRVIPDFPAMRFAQPSLTLLPTGETNPKPVTTTLRRAT
jgi:hypothetical protein